MIDRLLSLLCILNSFQQGSIMLSAGNYSLEIHTKKPPVKVWLSLKDGGDMPVCNGDVDKFSYTLTNKGFILYTDVVSDTVELEWLAEFN